jgi:hypothetical protein
MIGGNGVRCERWLLLVAGEPAAKCWTSGCVIPVNTGPVTTRFGLSRLFRCSGKIMARAECHSFGRKPATLCLGVVPAGADAAGPCTVDGNTDPFGSVAENRRQCERNDTPLITRGCCATDRHSSKHRGRSLLEPWIIGTRRDGNKCVVIRQRC